MLYQPAMASGGLTEAANGATTPLTAGSPTPTPSKPPKQPTTLSLNKASLRGSAQNLLEMATEAEVASAVPKACQVHENDRAEIVIVCEPEGASLLMGGLHPRASLYEQPINLEEARKQHEGFRCVALLWGRIPLPTREETHCWTRSNSDAHVLFLNPSFQRIPFRSPSFFIHNAPRVGP